MRPKDIGRIGPARVISRGVVGLALFGCAVDRAPEAGPKSSGADGLASQRVGTTAGASSALGESRDAVPVTSSSTLVRDAGPARPEWTPPTDGKRGITKDFSYDAADLKDKSRRYTGRVFAHRAAYESRGKLPLIVFFHGLNRALIPHRWMGGGTEGDVREIASDLFDKGAIGPAILAGPGSIQKDAVSFGASFPSFDFDGFVDLVVANLDPGLPIDLEKIVVLGHSGAGCSEKGGIVTALRSKHPIHAVVSIDTCMPGSLASALSAAAPKTNIVVTWQTATWDREFPHFRKVFESGVAKSPADSGVLRELDQLPNLPRSHDATVKQTFDKWLPRLLPGGP